MRMGQAKGWVIRFVVLAWCLLFSREGAAGTSVGAAMSLCAVAAAPNKYNNRLIAISARYESDGTHVEWLSDSACTGAGLELHMQAKTKGTEKLRLALRGGYPGTLDKRITGTFVGILHWDTYDALARSLDVQSIESVTVEPKRPTPAAKNLPTDKPGFVDSQK